MSENWNRHVWKDIFWGSLLGVLAGLLLAFAVYLYWQVRHPNPYNAILLMYCCLLFPVFGAMGGVLIAAMRK